MKWYVVTYAIAALHLEEVNSETTMRQGPKLGHFLAFCVHFGVYANWYHSAHSSDDRRAKKSCFLCNFKVRLVVGLPQLQHSIPFLRVQPLFQLAVLMDGALVIVTKRILANHNTFS